MDYPGWRLKRVELRDVDRTEIKRQLSTFENNPQFTVVVIDCEDQGLLQTTAESLTRQLYPHWRALVASPNNTLRTGTALRPSRDPRFSITADREVPPVDWYAFVEAGDELHDAALFCMAKAALSNPKAQLLYTDEEFWTHEGPEENPDTSWSPHCKPDWNPDLLLGQNYIGGLAVISEALAEDLGGIDKLRAMTSHDRMLRCSERLDDRQVGHIPHILHKHRTSTPHLPASDLEAVITHLQRTGRKASPSQNIKAATVQVSWTIADPAPRVSVLIPTRDHGLMLSRCIRSIDTRTEYPDIELVVVDHESRQRRARRILADLSSREKVTLLNYKGSFNFSAMMNEAAEAASGDILVLLNNDTEVLTPGWLSEIVGQLTRPEVGIVGALLLFGDGTIQHAGAHPGVGGLIGHGHKHRSFKDPGYFGRLTIAHEVAAVTGACLGIEASTWNSLGGLDEGSLSVAYNDIDLCLRARRAGLRVIFTPHAVLTHHESISRGFDDHPENRSRLANEVQEMRNRWGKFLEVDPAYSPNLSLTGPSFALASSPRTKTPWESD